MFQCTCWQTCSYPLWLILNVDTLHATNIQLFIWFVLIQALEISIYFVYSGWTTLENKYILAIGFYLHSICLWDWHCASSCSYWKINNNVFITLDNEKTSVETIVYSLFVIWVNQPLYRGSAIKKSKCLSQTRCNTTLFQKSWRVQSFWHSLKKSRLGQWGFYKKKFLTLKCYNMTNQIFNKTWKDHLLCYWVAQRQEFTGTFSWAVKSSNELNKKRKIFFVPNHNRWRWENFQYNFYSFMPRDCGHIPVLFNISLSASFHLIKHHLAIQSNTSVKFCLQFCSSHSDDVVPVNVLL